MKPHVLQKPHCQLVGFKANSEVFTDRDGSHWLLIFLPHSLAIKVSTMSIIGGFTDSWRRATVYAWVQISATLYRLCKFGHDTKRIRVSIYSSIKWTQ
jgi:hypothetical protein